jgi:hypothetical protein
MSAMRTRGGDIDDFEYMLFYDWQRKKPFPKGRPTARPGSSATPRRAEAGKSKARSIALRPFALPRSVQILFSAGRLFSVFQ